MHVRIAHELPQWSIVVGDAASATADVLICPANVFLTLSGGVGGELLRQHGDALQKELIHWLASRGQRFVQRGEIAVTCGCGSGYRVVLHAVAVDGLYRSSVQVVEDLVERCLVEASRVGAVSVVLTALATGYGRLTIADFGTAIAPLLSRSFGSVRTITLYLRNERDREQLESAVPAMRR